MRESDIRYTLETAGEAVMVRRTSTVAAEDLDIKTVGHRVFIRPKPVVDPNNDKFELVPEGDMFRVYALRTIGRHGILEGAKGGLIAHEDGLSQKGHCWIEEGVSVLGAARVTDDAYIYGSSILEGNVHVGGRAYLANCELRGNGGHINVRDDANLARCTVTGRAVLCGAVRLSDSMISCAPDEVVSLCIGEFANAHLTKFYEAFALNTRHGILTVYRGDSGRLVGNIGCQKFDTPEKLHRIARSFSATDQEKAMIDSFFVMVRTAQEYWTSPIQEEVQES